MRMRRPCAEQELLVHVGNYVVVLRLWGVREWYWQVWPVPWLLHSVLCSRAMLVRHKAGFRSFYAEYGALMRLPLRHLSKARARLVERRQDVVAVLQVAPVRFGRDAVRDDYTVRIGVGTTATAVK